MIKFFVRIGSVLLTLGLVFVIHEYGHLREFQKLGIPIKEFSIGIGPTAYQYETSDGMTVSLRIVPLMAYVMPTAEGSSVYQERASVEEKLVVSFAGIRNHLMVGVASILSLQVFGWWQGNITLLQLMQQAVSIPIKLMLRAGAFYLGCLTFGTVNKVEQTLLPTGNVRPHALVDLFVKLNLGFAFFNLIPFPGLDGYSVLVAFNVIDESFSSELPRWLMAALFGILFATADKQDFRVLKTQK